MRINKKRLAAVLVVALVAMGVGFAFGQALAEEVQEVSQVVEPTSQIVLRDGERELIERVVAAEARGECFEGQAAVAEVIYNRCISRDMTACEVVLQKGQFAKPYNGTVSEDIKQAVAAVFDYGVLNLDGAEYFHADYVNPSWADDMELICQIGGHFFYKEKAL